MGGGSALAFVLYGLGYALVHSWFSRNANWAVPALVPALALTLPWSGGLLHTMYLQAGFGVPSDAIHVSAYSSYAASLKPVGLALGLAAVPWCWPWPVGCAITTSGPARGAHLRHVR